jgi:uncharacterized YccA/Bax inhibitor family protein
MRHAVVVDLLVLLLIAGGFGLWIGVPVATLWGLGEVTNDFTLHFVAALFAVPLAMIAYTPGLFWLNGVYLRYTGRRDGGPLEAVLVISFVLAVLALSVWFFFYADSAPRQVI